MNILRLISRLLDYPTEELMDNKLNIQLLITGTDELSSEQKQQLRRFTDVRLNGDLLDWQAEYDGLFERGRSLSLLIYEHIHGESRDRGQAMVDLMAQYKAAGLAISVKELPDYIPLFLEFIATQGTENAKGWLQDIVPVLALLAVRLEKRDNNYQHLLYLLVSLAEADIDLDSLREQVNAEKPDNTKKALDKVWEEEAITFGGDAINGGCPSTQNRPENAQRRDQDVPIQFCDPQQPSERTNPLRSTS
ncbi:MAG: nitrate reductase molybdenum cofactor assembly chaperone [Aestuariibacter sp.]